MGKKVHSAVSLFRSPRDACSVFSASTGCAEGLRGSRTPLCGPPPPPPAGRSSLAAAGEGLSGASLVHSGLVPCIRDVLPARGHPPTPTGLLPASPLRASGSQAGGSPRRRSPANGLQCDIGHAERTGVLLPPPPLPQALPQQPSAPACPADGSSLSWSRGHRKFRHTPARHLSTLHSQRMPGGVMERRRSCAPPTACRRWPRPPWRRRLPPPRRFGCAAASGPPQPTCPPAVGTAGEVVAGHMWDTPQCPLPPCPLCGRCLASSNCSELLLNTLDMLPCRLQDAGAVCGQGDACCGGAAPSHGAAAEAGGGGSSSTAGGQR